MNPEKLNELGARARAFADRARPHVAQAAAEARTRGLTLAAEARRHYESLAASPHWQAALRHGRRWWARARSAYPWRRLPVHLAAVFMLCFWLSVLGNMGAHQARPITSGPAPRITRARVNDAAILAQADRESLAALEESTAEVASYLAACRQNSRAFAEWMLSGWGKLSYAAGRADQAWAVVKQLAQSGTMPATNSLPDRFGAEVRQKYAEMVVNPELTRRVVAQGLSSYAARLRQIEAKLVVDLGADVADEALGGEAMLPFDTAPMLSELDAALAGAMQAAEGDFFVAILRDFFTNRIGDAITDQVGADNWNILTNLIADQLVGEEVDRLAGMGLTRAGYDPEAKVTAAVEQSVDRLTSTTLARLRTTLATIHEQRKTRRAEMVRAALEGR